MRPWTESELYILRTDYGNKPTKAIARELGRSKSSIGQKAGRMGLKLPRGRPRAASGNGSSFTQKIVPVTKPGWGFYVGR